MNKEFNLEEAEEFIDNIYQHKFDDMEEILEDGTQVVHLSGLNDIKFTDFESASFTLLRGEQRLKQQCKKQKEVIDKINHYIEKQARMYGLSMPIDVATHLDHILGILKEVE